MRFQHEGELHLFTPEVVFLLQHSTRAGRHDIFGQYSDEVDRLSKEGGTLRGLFEFKQGLRPPVPLEDGIGRVDPDPLQHRRDELRVDLPPRRTRPWP